MVISVNSKMQAGNPLVADIGIVVLAGNPTLKVLAMPR